MDRTSDLAWPFFYTMYFLTTGLWFAPGCLHVCALTSPAQATARSFSSPGIYSRLCAHRHMCAEVPKPRAWIWATASFLPALHELEYNFISLARFWLCDHIFDTLMQGTEEMCLWFLFRCAA